MINREYGNNKEDQNLDFGGILKSTGYHCWNDFVMLSTGSSRICRLWDSEMSTSRHDENAFIALALVLVIIFSPL